MVPTNSPANSAPMNEAMPVIPNSDTVVGVKMPARNRPGAT